MLLTKFIGIFGHIGLAFGEHNQLLMNMSKTFTEVGEVKRFYSPMVFGHSKAGNDQQLLKAIEAYRRRKQLKSIGGYLKKVNNN